MKGMIYDIKIKERGTYNDVTLKNYDEPMMIAMLAVLSQDDEIDITISPSVDMSCCDDCDDCELYKGAEKVEDPASLPEEDKDRLREALADLAKKLEKE